jgi:putative membrane protein
MQISPHPFSHWHDLQRQSPAAIFILLGSVAVNLLKAAWPLLFVYFFKKEPDNDSGWIIWALIGLSSFSILGAIIGYWFKKFKITEDTLVIETGWLKKKVLSIPLQNIQAVHLEQNVWQQAFKVAKVSIDSTGSGKMEAKLEALSIEKAEQIKHLLMEHAKLSPSKEEEEMDEKERRYQLSFQDLIKLGLTANHLEAFFILFALGLNILDEVKQIFGGEDYLDSYTQQLMGQTIGFIWVLIIGVALISLLFSFFRTLLRFYGFELIDRDRKWIISYGLFERSKKIIPLDKIQILSWSSNLLRRKLNFWTMQVQSVGQKENKKSNIVIPITSLDQVVYLSQGYQPYQGMDYGTANKIEPEYWIRKSLLNGLPITLATVLFAFYWFSWLALGTVLLFFVLAWYYYQWYKRFRWQTNEAGIQLLSGFLGKKFTLLSWKKIQQVHIRQSLYQNNHQLADVIFLTAGGKVSLPYLSLPVARALVDHVLFDVESKEENWM